MKRFFALISVMLTMLFVVPLSAYAIAFDRKECDLSFSSAPKGTAYIDILVKMDENDENYVPFNVPPRFYTERFYNQQTQCTDFRYEDLQINADSEIARYNKDGYVSLLSHYRYAESLTIYDSPHNKDGCYADMSAQFYISREGMDIEELANKYGGFRVAYVDENGRVLGVTGKAKKSYDMNSPFSLNADGESLEFVIWGCNSLALFAAMAAFFGIPLIFLILIIRLIVRRIQRYKRRKTFLKEYREND